MKKESAEQLFLYLGYIKEKDIYNLDNIVYYHNAITDYTKAVYSVKFWLKEKNVSVAVEPGTYIHWLPSNSKPEYVIAPYDIAPLMFDMNLLEAINKQCEELSWKSKKTSYVRYKPCKCGCNRRENLYAYLGNKTYYELRCKNCRRTIRGKSKKDAKLRWNKAMTKKEEIKWE